MVREYNLHHCLKYLLNLVSKNLLIVEIRIISISYWDIEVYGQLRVNTTE